MPYYCPRLRVLVPTLLVLAVFALCVLFLHTTEVFRRPKVDVLSNDIGLRQPSRRHRVQAVCAQNGLGDPGKQRRNINHKDFSRIYVDDRYKLLYCEVPKVACTNWKRILLILSGHMNTSDPERLPAVRVHSDYQRKYLRTLDTFTPEEILEKLRTHYKFMFVREPLERIVSAYRNKLRTHYSQVYQERYGRRIVQRYRKNPSKNSLKYGNDVTFSEFVRYLLDPRTKVPFDPHWRPFYQLCHPCLVQYDFIGKYETLDTDVSQVLRELGVLHLFDFPDRPHKSGPKTRDLVDVVFKNITNEHVHNLWKLFSVDYAMFGYSYPDFGEH